MKTNELDEEISINVWSSECKIDMKKRHLIWESVKNKWSFTEKLKEYSSQKQTFKTDFTKSFGIQEKNPIVRYNQIDLS
jgi:hypothetical protein